MSPVESSALKYNYISKNQYTDLIAVEIDRDKIVIENISEPQRSQILFINTRVYINNYNLKVTAKEIFLGLYFLLTIADQII